MKRKAGTEGLLYASRSSFSLSLSRYARACKKNGLEGRILFAPARALRLPLRCSEEFVTGGFFRSPSLSV